MPDNQALGLMPDNAAESLHSRGGRSTFDPVERMRGEVAELVVELLFKIQDWARVNERQVGKLYLSVEQGAFRLYVVARSDAYDFELRKALSELVSTAADEGFTIHGSLIPSGTPEELSAFFNPDRAVIISGR